MSGEVDEDQVAEDVKSILDQNKRKITVEHIFKREGDSGSEGEKSTEEKLQEREAQLAALAIAEFDREKTKLFKKIPEEKHEEIDKLLEKDPKLIDVFKIQYDVPIDEDEDDGTEPVPPKGKARAQHKPSKTTVEDLYKILTSNDTTTEDKREAEKKLDELWKKSIQNKDAARKSLGDY